MLPEHEALHIGRELDFGALQQPASEGRPQLLRVSILYKRVRESQGESEGQEERREGHAPDGLKYMDTGAGPVL